ncbi:MAG: GFA family protein [Nevskiaceae bacterium]|nr:MAG: GFA family protein [Nevskiaceae bacterium]
MTATTLTGSCLCGGVRYRIDGPLPPIQICHCSQCRKAQGTPFATNAPVDETAFHLLSGDELLRSYESSPGKQRVFCGRCGSPVYSRNVRVPGVLRIRAGSLDEPLTATRAAHFHTASKCSWWPLDDDLPQYPQAYLPPPASP